MTEDTGSDIISDRITAIKVVATGDGFFECLQAIQPGRNANSQGYTYNRFIKVLNAEGLLPPEFATMNYGGMKVAQKNMIHSTIKSLSIDVHGERLFESLREAILTSYVTATTSAVPEVSEGVVVNRWALMAEFYIHPVSREGLENYSNKIPQEGKNHLLTDGMKQHRQGQITDLMRTCIEEVKPLVNNCFGERWPALLNIHPEKGTFTDVEQFSALLTEVKNTFDILKANLSMSGTQESGEILDGTALHFCKYGQRTAKLNHFYLWLCWKDKDLNFLSNTLQEGVATGGGTAAEPYSRSVVSSTPTSGASVKSSYAERKAAKGTQIDKVTSSISDVIKLSLGSILPEKSHSAEHTAARAEAYLLREAEQTLNLKLKRQREAIEAPSFIELSPSLQRKLRKSYATTLSECNE